MFYLTDGTRTIEFDRITQVQINFGDDSVQHLITLELCDQSKFGTEEKRMAVHKQMSKLTGYTIRDEQGDTINTEGYSLQSVNEVHDPRSDTWKLLVHFVKYN